MKYVFVTLPLFASTAALAGESCVWPFKAPPAEISSQMREAVNIELSRQCPGEHVVAIRFKLRPEGRISQVHVGNQSCKAALAGIKSWLERRPASAFLPYANNQDVAFTLRFHFGE